MAVSFSRPIPILRIFSVEKAREFYFDYLGFQLDWEHTFEPGMPIYMQVSRGDLLLHLSEHHGDGSPGAAVFIEMIGLQEFHAELTAKNYKYLRPGILDQDWGMREMHLIDPFGNRLRFAERIAK
jgi:catechol 2,3-dioxygenase-like lactoylglutathione lyase family enzyme